MKVVIVSMDFKYSTEEDVESVGVRYDARAEGFSSNGVVEIPFDVYIERKDFGSLTDLVKEKIIEKFTK